MIINKTMSRYLSYLLRHGAVKEGLSIDKEGYVDVETLLDFVSKKHSKMTLSELMKIVEDDNKQRFSLIKRDNKLFIRANQGHSMNVVTEDAMTPIIDGKLYPIVVHGTFINNLESILLTGLSKMSRNHIHFAQSQSADSGVRKNATVFIFVDLNKALADSIPFFLSENGVILTPGNKDGILEPKYFKSVIDNNGNDLLLPKEPAISCAGCIVFRFVESELQVCLIATHKGIYGFPKGKREKGERLIQGALRELNEETGIREDQITQLNETKFVDELSRNGIPSIRFFITTLNVSEIKLKPVDVGEIAVCEFVSIDKAVKLLNEKRQKVLSEAIKLLD